MNCTEFQTRLNDEFDGQGTGPVPELIAHTAECATCRATYDGFRLLADGIGAWRQETPDVDLAEAVVFALRQSAQPLPQKLANEPHRAAAAQPRTRRRSAAFPVTGAAVLLIVVSLLIVLRPGRSTHMPVAQVPQAERNLAATEDRRDTDQSANAQSANTPPETRHSDNEGTLPQVARTDSPGPAVKPTPYRDLAQRAAGAWGDMTMLVLPAGSPESETAPSPTIAEPPAERSTGWIDDVERGLKPVGRSLDNAFDFLWRAGESAGG